MTDVVKETTIAGVKYSMKLLRGENAVRAACVVTGPAFRAIDKLLAKMATGDGVTIESIGMKLPGAAAELFESIGFDGVMYLTRMFAEQTTVYLPSPAKGDMNLYPTPLASVLDTHFVGKWPAHLAWLVWGANVQGFFDVSSLLESFKSAMAQAKAVLQSQTESTGSSGASSSPTT